ncbi:MAG TPA: hypothetical protein VJ792_09540 [Candidatus Nitrosotalea sp.]|nr:hypothetical protein [Candidatus Nitrosotalea sp.]
MSPSMIPPIIPGTSTSILPTIPDLGTVSLALPVQVFTISKVNSGLILSDPLTNETATQQQLAAERGYWTYGGDAPAEGAPFDFYKDTQGLHIGVQAPADNTWAGYYAESQNTQGKLFHAVITTPVSSVSTITNPTWYENGLYVQTSQPFINYVTCFSLTGAWGTQWSVVSVTGNANQATQEKVLWTDTSANQPLTRDCTIITNGDNYLKVYLDGNMVYQSNNLHLQMPEPFNSYLEPQSSYSGQMLNGIYKDYYATTDENIKVTNNPIGASQVDLVVPNSSGSGTVVATAPVDSSGTATIEVGEFDMPLGAYIKVYNGAGLELASTSSPVNIYGGDQYSVSSLLGLGIGGL